MTGASSTIGGQTALVKGWLVDKLVKQAGFPRKAVERVLHCEARESVALSILGRRLCGWEQAEEGWGVEGYLSWSGNDKAEEERQITRDEETLALEAVLGERYRKTLSSELEIDIVATSNEKITLHIIFDQASPYPSPRYPTHPPVFYITSLTIPAYMRLYLHASLLREFRDPDRHDLTSVLQSGTGGAVLGMVEYLESVLPEVVRNPPDIGDVTKHLVSKPEEAVPDASTPLKRAPKRGRNVPRRVIPSAKDEEMARTRQRLMTDNPAYQSILDDRKRLPAWQERERITSALESNRVLVLVGEVSWSQGEEWSDQ